MKILYSFILFISAYKSYAIDTIEFKSKFNVFSQKLGPVFSLPVPLSERLDLQAKVELPSRSETQLKKVFTQTFVINEFKAVFEIYYFNQKNQKYFSQQIYMYKNNELITRCTSYFDVNQNYLVPGSCAGVYGGELYGIAVYKL